MPQFDPVPKTHRQLLELIAEVQKTAQDEGIQLTYEDGRTDADGNLVCLESNYMDCVQLMEFRDASSKEERQQILDYARFLDEKCYVVSHGYNTKLKRVEFGFRRKDNDELITFQDWLDQKGSEREKGV